MYPVVLRLALVVVLGHPVKPVRAVETREILVPLVLATPLVWETVMETVMGMNDPLPFGAVG